MLEPRESFRARWERLTAPLDTAAPVIITPEMDARLHEASAAAYELPERHRQMVDDWYTQARKEVFGAPWWSASKHARPVELAHEDPADPTGEASHPPASPVAPDEPDDAA